MEDGVTEMNPFRLGPLGTEPAPAQPYEIFRLERFSTIELSDMLSVMAFAQQYVDTSMLREEIRQELRRRDRR